MGEIFEVEISCLSFNSNYLRSTFGKRERYSAMEKNGKEIVNADLGKEWERNLKFDLGKEVEVVAVTINESILNSNNHSTITFQATSSSTLTGTKGINKDAKSRNTFNAVNSHDNGGKVRDPKGGWKINKTLKGPSNHFNAMGSSQVSLVGSMLMAEILYPWSWRTKLPRKKVNGLKADTVIGKLRLERTHLGESVGLLGGHSPWLAIEDFNAIPLVEEKKGGQRFPFHLASWYSVQAFRLGSRANLKHSELLKDFIGSFCGSSGYKVDAWVPNVGPLSKLVPTQANSNLDCKLSEMVTKNCDWNLDLFHVWLIEDIILHIVSILPPLVFPGPDSISWSRSTTGGMIRDKIGKWILGYNRFLGKSSVFVIELWGNFERVAVTSKKELCLFEAPPLEIQRTLEEDIARGSLFPSPTL
ncbi:hypothetical protein Goari_004685 [Gossypium aridum]|uniref:Uncharacterized protein n=1 Tax=Gossypium aridum TaxID=34290 RepID=A0A7J8Y5W4_GOSAI|nr:hypothetical protein [Gossypium aridum]